MNSDQMDGRQFAWWAPIASIAFVIATATFLAQPLLSAERHSHPTQLGTARPSPSPTHPVSYPSPSPVAPERFPVSEFPVRERRCATGGLLLRWGCWYAHTTPGFTSFGGIVLADYTDRRLAGAKVELFVETLEEPLVVRVGKRADFSFVNIPLKRKGTTWACFRIRAKGWPTNFLWGYGLYSGRGAFIVNLGVKRDFPEENVSLSSRVPPPNVPRVCP